MTKFIVIAIIASFLLYWGVVGINRRLRGEMPGRRGETRRPSAGNRRPEGHTPVEATRRPPVEREPEVRDARFRDVDRRG